MPQGDACQLRGPGLAQKVLEDRWVDGLHDHSSFLSRK
jgi:hypothetical protein